MALYDANDTEKTSPLDKASASKLQEHGHTVVGEDGEQVLLYIVTAAENAAKAVEAEAVEVEKKTKPKAKKAVAEVEADAKKSEIVLTDEFDKLKDMFKNESSDEQADAEKEAEVQKPSDPSDSTDEVAANETPNIEDADVAATEPDPNVAPVNEDAVVEGDKDALDRKGDGPANAEDEGYAVTGL
jgi:hypothetical protein